MKDETRALILTFFIDNLKSWARGVEANEERARPDLGKIMLGRLNSLEEFIDSEFTTKDDNDG